MSHAAISGSPPWRNTLVLSVATGALTVLAALLMFSAFMFYDDEGYVLISLKNFAAHGGLYRDVYTQYGPFPFVFYYAASLLGYPLTHIGGRMVTLAAWAGTALACGLLTTKATRSLIAGLAALSGAFVYLWVMASEPTHPGGLIVALTAGLGALGYRWLVSDQTRNWAILAGGGIAALALTKVNIGGFAACAALAWWWLHHDNDRFRRVALWIMPIFAVLLPLGLMRSLIETPWVRDFAWVFALSATAAMVAVHRSATARVGWNTALWGVMGGVGVAAVVLGVTVIRGTTLADLAYGIVLGPMRHPVTFSLRFLWPPGIDAISAASLALCLAARWLYDRSPRAIDTTIAILRIVLATGVAINIARYPVVSPDYLVFGWLMPCLWLFLWRLQDEEPRLAQARAWVGLLLLGQSLHVFPVPGSQIAWGTILVIPLAAMGAWSSAAWLAERPLVDRARRLKQASWLLRVALLGFSLLTVARFFGVANRYRYDANLELPGAEILRLPEDFTSTLRMLVLNAVAHADVLFSMPGMFSLNIWSGVPTPTYANTTHWFSLLDENRQLAIIRALDAQPRACVIVHRYHVHFLTGRGLPPKGPLRDYIEENFEPAFRFDDFEFCVRKGRTIHPLMVGDILTRAEAASANAPDKMLQITALLPKGKSIERIELTSAIPDGKPPIVLDAKSSRLGLQAANLRGEPVGAVVARAWPFTLEGPTVISIYYDSSKMERPPPRNGLIIFRAANGEKIALGRLRG